MTKEKKTLNDAEVTELFSKEFNKLCVKYHRVYAVEPYWERKTDGSYVLRLVYKVVKQEPIQK